VAKSYSGIALWLEPNMEVVRVELEAEVELKAGASHTTRLEGDYQSPECLGRGAIMNLQ
jgi:hypothetical protein